MGDETPVQKLKCYEKLTQMMQEAAEKAFIEVPEVRGMSIIFDWEVGQSEFPFGVLCGRDKEVTNLANEVSRLSQVHKMLEFLLRRLQNIETKIIKRLAEAGKLAVAKDKEENQSGE